MTKRKLPIGIQTFRTIREEGWYYVDKTAFAHRLVNGGTHYFLSRPRRFGKSLFVDTLKELFEGNEPLFRGLDVHDGWDWSVRHPVVRLDFSGRSFTEPGHLNVNLAAQLDGMERRAGLGTPPYPAGPERFAYLIEALHEHAGQRVAVLVDEYDKPILDALAKPELARANRDALRGLYSTIKASDAHVKFTFLTGVSKFSKVGIFSGLNNLIDITLEPAYSTICGYTERDLDTVFGPELPGLDRDRDPPLVQRLWLARARRRSTTPSTSSCCSVSASSRRTGSRPARRGSSSTPCCGRGVASPELDGMSGAEALLSAFDVDEMATEALLFQTGYLTIAGDGGLRRGDRLPAGAIRTARCARASTPACSGP